MRSVKRPCTHVEVVKQLCSWQPPERPSKRNREGSIL